jgi:hypothetical protein
VNSVLWNSPDLARSAAFHLTFYLYGPTQYLTLYPLAHLHSYAEIATVLLCAYIAATGAIVFLLWRTMTAGEPHPAGGFSMALCASLLFLPLIQCVVQREFEVVVFLSMCAGTYCAVTGRRWLAGGVFGYITWFKLLPMAFVAYFAMRRWTHAVLGFVMASVLLLVAAHAAFGLDRFILFNPKVAPAGHITSRFVEDALLPAVEGRPSFFMALIGVEGPALGGTGFCDRWEELNGTMVSVRWALCGINARHLWFPSREIFFVIAATLGAAFLWCFWGHTRRPHTALEDKWRTLWEISLVVFGSTFLIRAHVYYEIMLLLPLTALMYRYAMYETTVVRVGLLGASYVLLAGFVLPASILSTLMHANFWRVYMSHQVYLYGQLILVGLVFSEYAPRR